MEEIWKPIPDFPGYEASDLGNIRSYYLLGSRYAKLVKIPRIQKQTINSNGYYTIRLTRDHIQYPSCKVHRLILETFTDQCPHEMDACHNNGNRIDNRLTNLRWDTRKGNFSDKERHGTLIYGDKVSWHILTEQDVIEIRELYANGSQIQELVKRFGVSKYTIYHICNGNLWKRAGGPITKRGNKGRIWK